MWYRIKISREINQQGVKKPVTEYYLTDAKNFAYAGLKVIDTIGKNIEVEDILLMKSYKPAINEYKEGNKVYVIKTIICIEIYFKIIIVNFASFVHISTHKFSLG